MEAAVATRTPVRDFRAVMTLQEERAGVNSRVPVESLQDALKE